MPSLSNWLSKKDNTIRTRNIELEVCVLDSTIFLNTDTMTPIRGCLVLRVKKKQVEIPCLTVKLIGKTDINHNIETLTYQNRNWSCGLLEGGTYYFPFQFLLDGDSPESLSHYFANVTYELQAIVRESKAIANIQTCSVKVQVIKCAEILEIDDSLAIGNWRNLMIYRMAIDNKRIALGGKLNFQVRSIPIRPDCYNIVKLTIALTQATRRSTKVTTERIILHTCQITDDYLELSLPIEPSYTKFNRITALVHPSCMISDSVELFEVTHHIEMALTVEQLETDEDITLRPPPSAKSTHDTEDEWMISNAPIVNEMGMSQNKRVVLTMVTKLHLLKQESVLGTQPPPSYSDTLDLPPEYKVHS
ncbi:hypothetical protein OGAPHI_001485 [Ogataea philodendri]|uniref:Arrestin C-terminal-like domain-containing protein n=1 Tax=Ogataea philodendri TaxID=1378263 RepID=A0A9P8T8C0_9ASCO|nr:uncharacterized protein OGAPHI_001485 [Ogataea philodendri]KAH3669364.1 hypothetical protein OGAPHI_001485 [Ogataea philodendri]